MGMLGLIFGHGTPKRLKLEYRSTDLQRREDGFISVRPESLSARKRQSLAESGTDLHTYHRNCAFTPQIFMHYSLCSFHDEVVCSDSRVSGDTYTDHVT